MKRKMLPSKWHDFGPGEPVEDMPIACLTCGAEVIWSRSEDDQITSLYRKTPAAKWSKEHPACHEQTGLFG
jgi:hypothetical protein